MRNNLIALALTPLLVGPALANPYCYSCVPRVRTVVKTVVKEKAVAVQVPVFIVPTYSATFIPPAPIIVQQGSTAVAQQSVSYSQQQTVAAGTAYQAAAAVQAAPVAARASAECVTSDRLAQALEAINQRLCDLEKVNGNGPRPQQLPASQLPRAFTNKCSVCHTGAQAKGGFTMFEAPGKLALMSERDLRKVAALAYAGAMPPKDNAAKVPPLTDEEVSEIMQFVANQK